MRFLRPVSRAAAAATAASIACCATPGLAGNAAQPPPQPVPALVCPSALAREAAVEPPADPRQLLGSREPRRHQRQPSDPDLNLFGDLRARRAALNNRIGSLLVPEEPATDARGPASDLPALLPSAPTLPEPLRGETRPARAASAHRSVPRRVVASPVERRKTQNGMGWETMNWDPITEAFSKVPLERPGEAVLMLDVGCGYGRIARAAAANGGTVLCNDLDARHLLALAQEAEAHLRSRFLLHVGDFLADFPWRFAAFDAILLSRMAHFMSPKKFHKLLRQCRRLLLPGGRLFITTGTPYTRSFRSFRPEYERRKRSGDPWPGYIDGKTHKVTDYWPEARGLLPERMNLLDREVLDEALKEAQFQLSQPAEWIPHPDSPAEHAEDGRELVGAVGMK